MKINKLLICLLSIGFLLTGCGTNQSENSSIFSSNSETSGVSIESISSQSRDTVIHVTSMSLNRDALALEEDDTFQLSPYISPWNATNTDVTWNSANESIAKVSNTGLVTAKSVGSTSVTATTVDGGFVATCQITVNEKTIFAYEVGDSEVKILQNSYGKRLYCYTPIRNTGNVVIAVMSCSYNVEDLDGNLIQTISEYNISCTLNLIKPGEVAYCNGYIAYDGVLTEDNLVAKETISIKNASSYDPKRLDITNIALIRDTYNDIKVQGHVTNNMDNTANLAYIAFEIYDSDNNFVFGGESLLMDDILPDQTITFSVGSYIDIFFDSLNVDNCHAVVRGYQNQFIIIF